MSTRSTPHLPWPALGVCGRNNVCRSYESQKSSAPSPQHWRQLRVRIMRRRLQSHSRDTTQRPRLGLYSRNLSGNYEKEERSPTAAVAAAKNYKTQNIGSIYQPGNVAGVLRRTAIATAQNLLSLHAFLCALLSGSRGIFLMTGERSLRLLVGMLAHFGNLLVESRSR